MMHKWDCEIYQVADLLKNMLKYEENIENYDDRKTFGVFVDDLIEIIEIINEDIQDARQEVCMYDSRCEELEYQLDDERATNEDLRDRLDSIRKAVE